MSEKAKMTKSDELEKRNESKGEEKVITEKSETTTSSPTFSKTSKEVSVLTKSDLATLDYNKFDTPARMMALGEVLVKSKLVTGKTKEDVVVCLMAGQELGIPFVVSLSQIYPIDGKPSLGVHIIKGLMLKNKILFEKTEDCVPLFMFIKKDKEGKPVIVDGKPDVISIESKDKRPENTATNNKPVGYRVTYKFTREMKMPSGKYKEQVAYGSFSTLDAKEAELHEKTNWKRYWKRMLDARAFSIGAREIADDIICGMLTPDELGANSYIDDNGREIIQDITHEEI